MDGEPFWMSVLDETYPERAKELRQGEIPRWQSVDPQTELLAHILLELLESSSPSSNEVLVHLFSEIEKLSMQLQEISASLKRQECRA